METNNNGMNAYLVPVAVVLAGLFIGGAVIWNGSHPTGNQGTENVAKKVNVKDVKTDDEPFIGKADAPLTIAFWSDFQCPFCKAVEVGHPQIPTAPALPEIVKNYVDTGKAKVVFKDVVFLSPRMGPDSLIAAVYSRSVWKLYPAHYFEWRTAMFESQDEEGAGFGDEASVLKLTGTISGIDGAKVAADVKANRSAYEARSQANNTEAQKFGVNATPSFIIGTQLVEGAQPYSAFESVLKAMAK